MDLLIRKQDESDFEYKLRLCLMKLDKEIDLDWIEIVNLLELDVSYDHLRKISYGYQEYHEYIKNKTVENADKAFFSELEEKIREFEKEKIKFQDQKREYRNLLRVDARWEHLKETVISEVKRVNKGNLLSSVLTQLTEINQFDRKGVLVLSDWHIGMEIDSHWNVFNVEVAVERIKHLTGKTIQYCKEQNVDDLHIVICGDMIQGLIHTNARVQSSENAIRQTMIVSELLSGMVFNLSQKIPNISVYNTQGNHGRVFSDKNQAIESENFEKLIDWYMRPRLVECKNVEFMDSLIDDEIIELNIFNNKIYAVHGHNDRLPSVINNITQMTRTFPDMIICGHYHKDFQTEQFDTTLMVNGSFCGMDQYARGLRLSNVPHQKLIIFDRDDGQLCTYKIKLT